MADARDSGTRGEAPPALGGSRGEVSTARPSAVSTPPPDEESGLVIAIMGGSSRKGNWEPPARLRVFALMGGVDLDFREADLLEGETVVEIVALMGGVNIVVPPDIDVQADGTGFMGGFQNASNRAPEPDAPRLRISGLAVMGGVEVKVKKLPLRTRLREG